MSIFVCDKCGCIDNTALTHYWMRNVRTDYSLDGQALCSVCDPQISGWHGQFDRRQYDPATDRPINRPLADQPTRP